MPITRGITVLDLIAQIPAGLQGFIPAQVNAFIELLAIVEHRTFTSGRFFVHHGLVQSATDAGLVLPQGFPLVLPGLNRGVPFQFTHDRVALGAGNLEPDSTLWQLDLFLDQVGVVLPVAQPAVRCDVGPGSPGYLKRDPTRAGVQLLGSGVLQITGGAAGTNLNLIAKPNPMSPTDTIGTVLEFNLSPRHMLLHSSGLGMTIDRVVWDQSTVYTPAEIEARSHGPDWQGLAIKEASLYLPRDLPVFGDVTLGISDVLIGLNPSGFQGEASIEIGQQPLPGTVAFYQDTSTGVKACPYTGAGRVYKVQLAESSVGIARIHAVINPGPNKAVSWKLPGQRTWIGGNQTPWFTVTPDTEGAVLRMRSLVPADDGTLVNTPEVTFAIQREQGAPVEPPPRIKVTPQNGVAQENATSVSGSVVALGGITFTAVPTAPSDPTELSRLKWMLFYDGNYSAGYSVGYGEHFTPPVTWSPGRHILRLTDVSSQTRHIEIVALDDGALIIGCEVGVFDVNGAQVKLNEIVGSYSLDHWHDVAGRSAGSSANVDNGSIDQFGVLSAPEGVLVEGLLELSPEDKITTREVLHLRVLMEFDRTDARSIRSFFSTPDDPWGRPEPFPYATANGVDADPADDDENMRPFSAAFLSVWTHSLPAGTKFVVIGRCCDLGTDAYNADLAVRRAAIGKSLLLGLPLQNGMITDDLIYARGEQTPGSVHDAFLTQPADYTDPADEQDLAGRTANVFQIKSIYPDANTRAAWAHEQLERQEYRGVDIYAVVPAAAAAAKQGTVVPGSPKRRTALQPGSDRTGAAVLTPHEHTLGYSVRVRAKWDSPTFVNASDAIPTLVELRVGWTADELAVPGPQGGTVTPQPVTGATQDPMVYELIGRLAYDPRSGETIINISLDTPGDDRGLFDLVGGGGPGALAFGVALGLGPALLKDMETDDPAGDAVRVAALLTACVAVTQVNLISDARATVQRIELEHHLRAPEDGTGSRTKLMCDYTVDLAVANSFVQTAQPVKVRYKNIGVMIDNAKTGLDQLELIFEDADFQIADPGRWTMNGVLGDLLGVTEVRLGVGSIWFEIDLAFALDLGVIEVTKATVRITIEPGQGLGGVTVELRGLGAHIDVPGVIDGGGELKVGAQGDISAALDITIVPAQISAWGALVIDPKMTMISAGVRFATGIPLFSTGLGIYGFLGRFVSGGKRKLPPGTDPVDRELAWYCAAETDKYEPCAGQYALGLGAIIGTLPDAGFSFNATGMLAVGFPDISVVFGIDAKFVSKPDGAPKEKGDKNVSSLKMLGLVAVDADGVALGVRGSYEIPRLLSLKIPAGAYFPLGDNPIGAYVRIGSDGKMGRSGEPVSLTVLPGLLDQKCWAYFMVEERELPSLGGNADFSFTGFSIGFGAGWGFKWGGGPIYLRASLTFLVGLGTRPFVVMGLAHVEGELRLVIVSISVSGEVTIRLADNGSYLKGKFCGKVSFFFFDIEGCVEFTIDGSTPVPAPPPGDLVSGVSLADTHARVVADANKVDSLTAANTAWPDVCPILHFSHRISLALAPGGFQPNPSNGWPGNDWSGSTRLKYLYRLKRVTLKEGANVLTTEDWVSTWWLPSHKAPLGQPGQPLSGEHEGWDLALLDWNLAPWSRNLPSGGEDLPGDPVITIGKICDPVPPVTRGCVIAEIYKRLDVERVRLRQKTVPPQPYGSVFELEGVEGRYPASLATAVTAAVNAGRQFSPGALVGLPGSITPAGEPDALKFGYRLPYTSLANAAFESLSLDSTFSEKLVDPDLVLGLRVRLQSGDFTETCVEFVDFSVGNPLPSPLKYRGFTFTDPGMSWVDVLPRSAPDKIPELRGSGKTLRVDLPAVAGLVRAQVALITGTETYHEGYVIRMTAYDANNVKLGEATTPDTTNALQTLLITAPNIAYVTFTGGGGQMVLKRICYGVPNGGRVDWTKLAGDYFAKLQSLPVVQGVFAGNVDTWTPTQIGLLVKVDDAMLVLQYRPPKGSKLRYEGARILTYNGGPKTTLLSVCGVTGKALDDQAADQSAHDDLKDHIKEAADGPEEKRHRLLAADQHYTIEVEYDWAGWQPTDDKEKKPPPIDTFDWSSPPATVTVGNVVQKFHFKTATAGKLADAELLSAEVQHTFDPRAVARYLTGFDPARTQPTHFLGDELRVAAEVEWIPTLLARYGRELKLRVARTDPPPAQPGQPMVLEANYTVAWGGLPKEMLPVADQRIAAAIEEAPCLPDSAPPQGSLGKVTADLEPDASYDFIVSAVVIGDPKDEVVIGRSHFHTSRYKDPAGLVTALGFTAGAPNPEAPHEFLVAVGKSAPIQQLLASDQGVDDALTALGMDPWPLPTRPQTVMLWQQNGSAWQLIGVLLDSDEPMNRPTRMGDTEPRLTIDSITIAGNPLAFNVHRSNAAGTRLLLVPITPPLLAGPNTPVLQLNFTALGSPVSHSRYIQTLPGLVLKEMQP